MFSGIVEELGEIKKISRRGNINLLEIKAGVILEDLKIGDSVSVNGVCLTIVTKAAGFLSFEAMPETLKVTNLGGLKIKDKVNLERALKVGDRISGHFVSGHVDCLGVIRRKGYVSGNLCFEIALPVKLISNITLKGSITIDGISLTVVSKTAATFSVYVIPHTINNTTLKFKGPSDKVNIEFDILVKNTNRVIASE